MKLKNVKIGQEQDWESRLSPRPLPFYPLLPPLPDRMDHAGHGDRLARPPGERRDTLARALLLTLTLWAFRGSSGPTSRNRRRRLAFAQHLSSLSLCLFCADLLFSPTAGRPLPFPSSRGAPDEPTGAGDREAAVHAAAS